MLAQESNLGPLVYEMSLKIQSGLKICFLFINSSEPCQRHAIAIILNFLKHFLPKLPEKS